MKFVVICFSSRRKLVQDLSRWGRGSRWGPNRHRWPLRLDECGGSPPSRRTSHAAGHVMCVLYLHELRHLPTTHGNRCSSSGGIPIHSRTNRALSGLCFSGSAMAWNPHSLSSQPREFIRASRPRRHRAHCFSDCSTLLPSPTLLLSPPHSGRLQSGFLV